MTLHDLLIRLQEEGIETLSSFEPNFETTVLRFKHHVRGLSSLAEERLDLVVKTMGQRLHLTIKADGHALRWPRKDEEFANSNRIYFSCGSGRGMYLSVTNDSYASFFDTELGDVLTYLKKCL